MNERFLPTLESMLDFGKEIAARLKEGDILALTGDLGAGKTTFVQGLGLGLGIEESISSPTFVTLNIYEGAHPLYHFDLYRLKDAADFQRQGFDEYFEAGGVCAIEWPERIAALLPARVHSIAFRHTENGRTALLGDSLC